MRINEEENLVIQPMVLGKMLMDLKAQDFLNTSYYQDNFNGWFSDVLKQTTLDSQGMVIVLFYIFLVIPKEIFKTNLLQEYNLLNKKIDSLILQNICKITSNYNDSDYLRHMRNSIAHVKLKFIGGQSITFLDDDSKMRWTPYF